jgi:hypothetical protein
MPADAPKLTFAVMLLAAFGGGYFPRRMGASVEKCLTPLVRLLVDIGLETKFCHSVTIRH